jgi:hypothetical protein
MMVLEIAEVEVELDGEVDWDVLVRSCTEVAHHQYVASVT